MPLGAREGAIEASARVVGRSVVAEGGGGPNTGQLKLGWGEGASPAKIMAADLVLTASAEAVWNSESYQSRISGERNSWMAFLFAKGTEGLISHLTRTHSGMLRHEQLWQNSLESIAGSVLQQEHMGGPYTFLSRGCSQV
jgi:hypothetical protein